jgi:hypothetical protein
MSSFTKPSTQSRTAHSKGQINMEYFVSLIVFVTFAIYFAFQLVDYYPRYIDDVKDEIRKSDVYRLSEMLINDDGSPDDWEVLSNPDRIGLSDQTQNASNMISVAKITEMETMCNADYSNVRDLVGSTHNFYLTVEDMYGPLSIQCGQLPLAESVALATRIVALDNGNYARVTVQMW